MYFLPSFLYRAIYFLYLCTIILGICAHKHTRLSLTIFLVYYHNHITMKKILTTILTALLIVSGVFTTSQAATRRLNSSEGTSFYIAFTNNLNASSLDQSLDLEVIVTGDTANTIVVQIGSTTIDTLHIPAGGGMDTLHLTPEQTRKVYLEESERIPTDNIGWAVYAFSADQSTPFSCFGYSRTGVIGSSSRDAFLVLPVDALGTEYMVQTYPEEGRSTEFAIVATHNQTELTITPTATTFSNRPAHTPFTVTLQRGQAYLVSSTVRDATTNIPIDLSGSRICSNHPVGVFEGNQAVKIPEMDETASDDYQCEQVLPIRYLGRKFYVAQAEGTLQNEILVTAVYPNTTIHFHYYDADLSGFKDSVLVLQAGETCPPFDLYDEVIEDVVIESDRPVICNYYMSSSGFNSIRYQSKAVMWGDPGNAFIPAWEHRLQQATFFAKRLDPTNATMPQRYFAHVITRATDVNTFSIDGTAVPSTNFHSYAGDRNMAWAAIELDSTGYHRISTTGQGFVGFVYGITNGQGYTYSLGYNPMPGLDSLYVTNASSVMSATSYDLSRMTDGWYSRQLGDFPTLDRLDTAVVCDGTELSFLVRPSDKGNPDSIRWQVYAYDSLGHLVSSPVYDTLSLLPSDLSSNFSYTFRMPDQDSWPSHLRWRNRLFQVVALVQRPKLICTDMPDDTDTLRSMVYVQRSYNDTVHYDICDGDTFVFFDSDTLSYQLGENTYTRTYSEDRYCDSTITLVLHVHPVYDSTEYRHEPNNQVIHWQHRELGPFPDILSDTLYFDTTYTTSYGCDSTYHLVLRISRSFKEYVYDTVCVSANSYTWYGHTAEHLYDKTAGESLPGTKVSSNTFSSLPTGWHIFQDSLTMTIGSGEDQIRVDSLWQLNLYVAPTYRDTVRYSLCPSDTIEFGEYTYLASRFALPYPEVAVFDTTVIRSSTYGCDSVVRLELTIYPSFYQHETHAMCADESYTWHGQAYSSLEAGEYTYYDRHTTTHGCDSVYSLTLTVHPTYFFSESATICIGETYHWRDRDCSPLSSTLYYDSLTSSYGCDSVYCLSLTVRPSYAFYDTLVVDQEQSNIQWQSYTYNRPSKGVHRDTAHYTSVYGCDSVYYLTMYVHGITHYYVSICQDTIVAKPYEWRGHQCPVYEAGSFEYRDTVASSSPNKDIYVLHLTIHPVWYALSMAQLSNETSYTWSGNGVTYLGVDCPSSNSDAVRILAADTTVIVHFSTQFSCDSTLELRLRQGWVFRDTLFDTICADQPYTWRGTTIPVLNSPGSSLYYDSLKTVMGYDSIYVLSLTRAQYYPVHDTRIDRDTICVSDSYTWHGSTFSHLSVGEHTFHDTLLTSYGCDSVWTLSLHVLPLHFDTTMHTMSDEEYFVFEHTLYLGARCSLPTVTSIVTDTVTVTNTLSPNYYTFSYSDWFGCDSVRVLRLCIGPVSRDTLVAYACDNESYFWRGMTIPPLNSRTSATYYDSLTTVMGYDSIFVLDLRALPTYHYFDYDTVCQYTPYVWEGHIVPITTDKSGTFIYTDSLHTEQGCDSVWTLSITLTPAYYFRDTLTVCDHDTLSWRGRLYVPEHFTATLTHTDSVRYSSIVELPSVSVYRDTMAYLTTRAACDSSYYLTLQVLPTAYATIHEYICDNDSSWTHLTHSYADYQLPLLTLGSHDTTLLFVDTITSSLGCDSVIHYYLSVHPTYRSDTAIVICSNEPTDWRSHRRINMWQTGTYIDTVPTAGYGCDSLFVLHLTVVPSFRSSQVMHMCKDDTIDWQYQRIYYTPSDALSLYTHYQAVYATESNLCDSVYELDVYYHDFYHFVDTAYICANDSFFFQGTWLHDEGTYYRSYQTTNPLCHCDSTYELTLIHRPIFYYHQFDTVCRSDNGTYIWNNEFGQQLADEISLHTPGDYHFEQNIGTIYGCDSIFAIDLHVGSDYEIDSIRTICTDSITYWQGQVFRGSELELGTRKYIKSYISASGCDSIHTLTLTVVSTLRTEYSAETCANEPYFFGGKYRNESGYYHDTLFSVSCGCDSIVDLYLMVHPSYTIYDTALVICPNETVTLHGRTYSSPVPTTIVDTIFASSIHGCDSILTLRIKVAPTYSFVQYDTVCAIDPYIWHGQDLTAALRMGGTPRDTNLVFYDNHRSVYGCDSVYELRLHALASSYTERTDYLCPGQGYVFHGRTLRTTGIYTDTTVASSGCYFIDRLHLLDASSANLFSASSSDVCADAQTYSVVISGPDLGIESYSVFYSERATEQGFRDLYRQPYTDSVIDLPIPEPEVSPYLGTTYVRPDRYAARIELYGYCSSALTTTLDYTFRVLYPASTIVRISENELSVRSSREMGGVGAFTDYLWSVDGVEQPDAVYPTFTLPDTDPDHYYSVSLRRKGESYFIPTCDYTLGAITALHDADAPTPMVRPSVVSRDQAVTWLYDEERVSYTIYDSYGQLFFTGTKLESEPSVMLRLPSVSGLYIIYLEDAFGHSYITKVLVR